MEIKKCCENCVYSEINGRCLACIGEDDFPSFRPKEELVRADEREKIITDLEYEIQNFNEVRDSKTIDFIYSFIKELKEK